MAGGCAPYDRDVDPLAAGLLGAFVGALVGALAVALGVRHRIPDAPTPADLPPEDLAVIAASVRSAVAVIGPADELVAHNDAARGLGIVNGTRLAIPAVHELVRGVRVDGEAVAVNLEHVKSGRRPGRQLAVRVAPLSQRLTLVTADDREPALRLHATSRDFMANATHELKTPVGAISLLAEAVEGAADDPDAVRRFPGRIVAEAERLSRLVSQIIALSKLQGGEPTLDDVDVDDVVEHSLERIRHLATARSISLASTGEPDLTVLGDADQIGTAVTNLLQNAIAYSDENARVTVTTRRDGDLVVIAVSDTGIGIAPADAERVFERFYRVDYGRARSAGGTGLGLSIVKEIAENHGGEVTVWSQVGAGSTFTLRLPAASERAQEASWASS